MNTPGKFEMRDPAELRGHIHPALKTIPELTDDSPEFLAIAAGVGKCGIIQPLIVDEHGRILDDHSRTLLRCALRWQLKTVPVHIRPEEDVHLIVIHSIAHRRHFSKSAIAYLAVPHLQPAFEIARQRRLKQIKDNPEVSAETTETTVEALAENLGIGRNLLFEAQRVHQAFGDKKVYAFNVRGGARDGEIVECTLKAWYEPKLLQPFTGGEHESNRPLGLGGILAGIASIKEGDKLKYDPRQARQLDLFTSTFVRDFSNRYKFWRTHKAEALKAIEHAAATMSAEECRELSATLKEIAKVYERESTAANKA